MNNRFKSLQVVLGAGPAGLAAAYRLAECGRRIESTLGTYWGAFLLGIDSRCTFICSRRLLRYESMIWSINL